MHPETAAKIAEILSPPRPPASPPPAPASRPFSLADIVQPRFSRAPEPLVPEPLLLETIVEEPSAPVVAEEITEVPLPASS